MDSRLATLLEILERSPAFHRNPCAAALRQLAAPSPEPIQIEISPNHQIQTHARPPGAPVLVRHFLIPESHPGIASADHWLEVGYAEWVLEPYWILAGAADRHFHGQLAGRLILGHGLDAQRGAWPLAATINGAACLALERDADRLKACLRQGWIDFKVNDLDEALRILKNAVRKHQPIAVGLEADTTQAVSALTRIGVVPDLALIFHGDENAEDSDPWLQTGLRALENLGTLVCALTSPPSAGAWPGDRPQAPQPIPRRGLRPLRWFAPQASPREMTRLDARLVVTFTADTPLARWLRGYSRHFRDALIPSRAAGLDEDQFATWQSVLAEEIKAKNLSAPVLFCRDELLESGGQVSYFVFPDA